MVYQPHPRFLKLYQAIDFQDIDLLKTLLSNKQYLVHLDWDEDREDYETLLEQAVAIGNLAIVQILLEKGHNLPYWSRCLGVSIALAANLNNLEIVQTLIDAGADANTKVREPPIIPAAGTGNIQLVQLLISSGADVNSVREEGVTPLMTASISGSIEIVKLLVEHGARVDATLVDGWQTALHLARYYKHEDVCQYLEAHI
ncbi:ankyrin repeat domain-containing protein [Microcoleus sp. B4-C5]